MKLEIIIYKLIYKIFTLVLSIILSPLSFILHILGFRHFKFFFERIGHFAVEVDCLIKEIKLGREKNKYILAIDKDLIPNHHLLKYWKKYFYIYDSKFLFLIISCLSKFGLMSFNGQKYLRNKFQFQEAYSIYNQWGSREPMIDLNYEDKVWSKKMLKKLGVPENSWHVVVHARTEGYSKIDDNIQNYRNSEIKNSLLAIKKITDLGGWVIRIGDTNMPKLDEMENVIDYAWSNLKCDRLDFCIIANARFMIGNTSGITCLASVMGIPCAVTNVVPISVGWLTEKDIFIPKLLWSNKLSRYLTYKEILESEISRYNYTNQYKKSDIKVIENSAYDILCLVKEMLDQINNSAKVSKTTFQQIFKNSLNSNHYGYKSMSKISQHFVKNHMELFR